MLSQTKYILVIIAVLLLILYFINDSKLTNSVKDNFKTISQPLNKINNKCNPTVLVSSSSNFCDCSGTSYHNQYALYDSNDNKKYDVIAKCNLGDNQWRWRAVGTSIRYNHPNYTNCSKSGIENYHLYACKANNDSSDFSLWDNENRKWVA
jgi:hypothetical protein